MADFKNLEILLADVVQTAEMRHHTKFCQINGQSFVEMEQSTILDFKVPISITRIVWAANM